MRFNDYDSENPPPSTHQMEMQRKLGIALPRFGIGILLLLLAGVDVEQIGLLHLPELTWVERGLTVAVVFWSGWPLLQGIEHGIHELRS